MLGWRGRAGICRKDISGRMYIINLRLSTASLLPLPHILFGIALVGWSGLSQAHWTLSASITEGHDLLSGRGKTCAVNSLSSCGHTGCLHG